jgi:hypothetical protein
MQMRSTTSAQRQDSNMHEFALIKLGEHKLFSNQTDAPKLCRQGSLKTYIGTFTEGTVIHSRLLSYSINLLSDYLAMMFFGSILRSGDETLLVPEKYRQDLFL